MADNTLSNSSVININESRDKIRLLMIEEIKSYYGLKDLDLSKTSFLSYVINVMSMMTSNLMWYNSTTFKEFFLTKAQMPESIYNLAKWIGYTPPKAISATVDVTFKIPLAFNDATDGDIVRIDFPSTFSVFAGQTKFTLNSDYFFKTSYNELYNNVSWSQNVVTAKIFKNNTVIVKDNTTGYSTPVKIINDENNKKVALFNLQFIQAEKLLKRFVIPSDLQFYRFYTEKITDIPPQAASIKVYVIPPEDSEFPNEKLESFETAQEFINYYLDKDGDTTTYDPIDMSDYEWEESETGIYTLTNYDKKYAWSYVDGILQIQFGNGVIGKQPDAGSTVIVLVDITNGSQGNIASGSVTNGDNLYYYQYKTDSDDNDEIIEGGIRRNCNYTIVNVNAAQYGKDAPTLNEVRNNAIAQLSSRKRLVSEDDYLNYNLINPEAPLYNSKPILKRSDLKINEITMFNQLTYQNPFTKKNEIVPTRTVVLPIVKKKTTSINMGEVDFVSDKHVKKLYGLQRLPNDNYSLLTNVMYTTDSDDTIIEGVYDNGNIDLLNTVNKVIYIDGNLLKDGDTILLKNQTKTKENGIWVVQSGSYWKRIFKFDDKGNAYTYDPNIYNIDWVNGETEINSDYMEIGDVNSDYIDDNNQQPINQSYYTNKYLKVLHGDVNKETYWYSHEGLNKPKQDFSAILSFIPTSAIPQSASEEFKFSTYAPFIETSEFRYRYLLTSQSSSSTIFIDEYKDLSPDMSNVGNRTQIQDNIIKTQNEISSLMVNVYQGDYRDYPYKIYKYDNGIKTVAVEKTNDVKYIQHYDLPTDQTLSIYYELVSRIDENEKFIADHKDDPEFSDEILDIINEMYIGTDTEYTQEDLELNIQRIKSLQGILATLNEEYITITTGTRYKYRILVTLGSNVYTGYCNADPDENFNCSTISYAKNPGYTYSLSTTFSPNSISTFINDNDNYVTNNNLFTEYLRIDDYELTESDYVLLVNQKNQDENGVYKIYKETFDSNGNIVSFGSWVKCYNSISGIWQEPDENTLFSNASYLDNYLTVINGDNYKNHKFICIDKLEYVDNSYVLSTYQWNEFYDDYIPRGTKIQYFGLDKLSENLEEFETMFDIKLNPYTLSASYNYVNSSTVSTVTHDIINKNLVSNVLKESVIYFLVTSVTAQVLGKYNRRVKFTANIDHVDNDNYDITMELRSDDQLRIRQAMVLSADKTYAETIFDSVNMFNEDELNYTIYVYATSKVAPITGESTLLISKFKFSTMIKRSMIDMMYSSLTKEYDVNTNAEFYFLHGCPTILTQYLDLLDDATSQQTTLLTGRNIFELTTMQQLINSVNTSSNKMLTDFINFVFCDSAGQVTNMKYNKTDNPADVVIKSRSLNQLPHPDNLSISGDYLDGYIVNGFEQNIKKNDGDSQYYHYPQTEQYPWKNDIGKIKVWVGLKNSLNPSLTDSGWETINPSIGYTIRIGIKNEFGVDHDKEDQKMLVYNGHEWIEPVFDIPVKIILKVAKANYYNKTDKIFSDSIKNALVEYYSPYTGLDINIDRSDIIKVARSVEGVKFVEVLEPSIDIVFNYDTMYDLTHKELLDYVPQLVAVAYENIEINIVSEL